MTLTHSCKSRDCKTCTGQLPSPSKAIGRNYDYWQAGETVNVYFIGGTTEEVRLAKETFAEFQTIGNLKINYVTNINDSQVRVSHDPNSGAWSYIGKDALLIPKNQATLNLGFNDIGTRRHEIGGHCLSAMQHEHQFPNWLSLYEQVVIADMKEYGWDEATTRHNILSKLSQTLVDTSDSPDELSIMMYWLRKTWVRLPADFTPRDNSNYSQKDIEFIQKRLPFDDVVEPQINEMELLKTIFREMGIDIKDIANKRLKPILKLLNIEPKRRRKDNIDLLDEFRNS